MNSTMNDDDHIDEADDEALPRSIVKSTYRLKYAERATASGKTDKAAKRRCGDWLSETLAKHTLDEDAKLKITEYEAILTANGVKHEAWNRTTRGWQGRLRMTGRLALQRIVAENGELIINDTPIRAPKNWCNRIAR